MRTKYRKMKITRTIFVSKTLEFLTSLQYTLTCLCHWCRTRVFSFLLRLDPFWRQLCYFVTLFMLGYFVLSMLEPPNRPTESYDLLFMAVSAVTVSSMSTIEMEVFSNTQLFCLAVLMLLGGEVFTSMLELQFQKLKLAGLENGVKYNSIKFLGFIALSYFLMVQVSGFVLVSVYVGVVSSANEVLRDKNLNVQVFSFVTTISTFSNCGFVPTNEGMVVFKKNLGLLIILIPLVLLGNTLYPVFLRLALLLLRKISSREELQYVLENEAELGCHHLLSGVHSWYLALTSIGFIVIQFVLLVSIGWKSEAMEGQNPLEKLVASLFQVVNTRHTGQSVFDLSLISPAIIILFVTMMYLPAYTYFLPREDKQNIYSTLNNSMKEQKKTSMGFLLLSPLPVLVIIIMLICITESDSMQKDPLNFSVLNIIFEVISAYGNVGFSLGYSCKRQIHPQGDCRDAWYGFAGRWSNIGKLILVVAMIFGRLRKFHKRGGKAWKLS